MSATLSLLGITVAEFGAAQQSAFIGAVAILLNVTSSEVSISSITAATASRRFLLAGVGVNVAFTVAVSSPAAATALVAATTSIGSAAALPGVVSVLQAAGLPVSGVALVSLPTVVDVSASPPPALPVVLSSAGWSSRDTAIVVCVSVAGALIVGGSARLLRQRLSSARLRYQFPMSGVAAAAGGANIPGTALPDPGSVLQASPSSTLAARLAARQVPASLSRGDAVLQQAELPAWSRQTVATELVPPPPQLLQVGDVRLSLPKPKSTAQELRSRLEARRREFGAGGEKLSARGASPGASTSRSPGLSTPPPFQLGEALPVVETPRSSRVELLKQLLESKRRVLAERRAQNAGVAEQQEGAAPPAAAPVLQPPTDSEYLM